LAEQVYLIQGEEDITNGWFLTWEQLGTIFGLKRGSTRQFYYKGKKYIQNGTVKSPGRASILASGEELQLIKWLDVKWNEHEPPTAAEIVIHVKKVFNKNVSDNWPYSWRNRYKTVLQLLILNLLNLNVQLFLMNNS